MLLLTPPLYSIYANLSRSEKEEILKQLQENNFKPKIDCSFNALVHELGHLKHEQNNPRFFSQLEENFPQDKITGFWDNTAFKKTEPNYELTSYVSSYSKSSPLEFVAEMYSALASGKTYCDELMEMYKKYGGPEIKGIFEY